MIGQNVRNIIINGKSLYTGVLKFYVVNFFIYKKKTAFLKVKI